MRKLLLLDCDGTIREPIEGKWIDAPKNQRVIVGAAEAIAKASASGWTIIGISNQGGVEANHKSLENAIREQRYTLELLPNISGIYFCPDFDGEVCWCVDEDQIEIRRSLLRPSGETYKKFRKPEPGMIELALDWLGEVPEKVWCVGDREEDALASAAAGIDFMWADVWRSLYQKGEWEVDTVSRHLSKEILLKFLKDFQE